MMERLHFDRLSGKVKASSIIFAAAAAAIALSYSGSTFKLPSSKALSSQPFYDSLKGSIFAGLALITSTCYSILLGKTLEIFPAPIALAAGVTTMGALIDLIGAFTVHKIKLHRYATESPDYILAVLYGGILASSLGSVLTGVVVRRMGPVFSAAFSPLALVLGMLFNFFVAKQPLLVGSVVAVILVSTGLSLLVWGKHRQDVESAAQHD